MTGSDGDRTVAFLDLTGYTSLTDTHGDAAAVAVIDRFLEATEAAVAGAGRIVKTLGDGVLLDFDSAGAAVTAAATINGRLHDVERMPELTGGIATGTLITRGDDVFGATVNLAARLADLASPGELRVTEAAAAAASAAGWTVVPVGPTRIRGLHDPVPVHRVLLCEPAGCVTDPVCGMRIAAVPGMPSTVAAAGMVWFCEPACAERFGATPDRYLVDGRTRG